MLYAPTGELRNSLETMGEELIAKLDALDRYDILVKLHDHPHGATDWWSRLAPLESEHVRLVREPDVVRTMSIADLLISDASSVANEFALLDRPIVFLDVPELIELTLQEGGAPRPRDVGPQGRRRRPGRARCARRGAGRSGRAGRTLRGPTGDGA